MMGIYQIKNIANEKIYVGSSANITNRWKQHLENLFYNIHENYKLQNDFNKYGINFFNFTVLEIIKNKKDLLLKEQEYIDDIDVENNYNILSYSNYEYVDRVKDDYSIVDFEPAEHQKRYLKNNIIIVENKRMNEIGEEKGNLNKTWFNKCKKQDLKILKRNIRSFHEATVKGEKIYWTTFTSYQRQVQVKGVIKSFVSLIDIPTEKRNNIAYLANSFVNPILKRMIGINDDDFALKVLLNWIINTTDITLPINIYIPSKRMRELLVWWLNNKNI